MKTGGFAKADWLAHGLPENRAGLLALTVQAFIRCRTNTATPFADFCRDAKQISRAKFRTPSAGNRRIYNQ